MVTVFYYRGGVYNINFGIFNGKLQIFTEFFNNSIFARYYRRKIRFYALNNYAQVCCAGEFCKKFCTVKNCFCRNTAVV